MAKLSTTTTVTKPPTKKKEMGGQSPIATKKSKTVKNPDGIEVPAMKAKSELFLTAISTFAGEDTYYETAENRTERIVKLTHEVTKKDPEWIEKFVPWLRGPEVNLRTVSLIIAAEYVAAGGTEGRKLIREVCQRADEPAEILAYWVNKYGYKEKDKGKYPLPAPKIPQAIRKGVADAAARLYSEYSVLKYSGESKGFSMSQVLNLTHPSDTNYPKDWTQKQIDEFQALSKYIIDFAYDNPIDVSKLPMIKKNMKLRKKSREQVLELTTDELRDAGITWEQMGSLLQGPWTAKAWEAIIPTMGYMALLRNLRNFDAAGISKTYRNKVIATLTDPQKVAGSRQLPFRFFSAYRNLNSDNYSTALADALDLSCKNIPKFEGKTLVLVDKSGSMSGSLSRGARYGTGISPQFWEIGALFGAALTLAQADADIAIFGDRSKRIVLPKGSTVLKSMQILTPNNGVGHGTNIWGSVWDQYDGHNRVVIFTDMQSNIEHQKHKLLDEIDFIHVFNLAGYSSVGMPMGSGKNGRYQYGGFSDATFKMMELLETTSVGWPFV